MFCLLFPDIIRMCVFVPCASRQARVYFFLHISPIDNRQSRRSLSGMPCRDRLRPRQGTLAPLGAIYLRSMSRISLPPAGTYLRCRPAEPVFLAHRGCVSGATFCHVLGTSGPRFSRDHLATILEVPVPLFYVLSKNYAKLLLFSDIGNTLSPGSWYLSPKL